jgi:Holliday junction resolvase
MKTPEGYEKDDICKWLYASGYWFFKPAMNGFGKSGVPDIVACIEGKFVTVEVKREGKEPTPIQERRMAEIRKAGGAAFWGTAAKVIFELEEWRAKQIVSFA